MRVFRLWMGSQYCVWMGRDSCEWMNGTANYYCKRFPNMEAVCRSIVCYFLSSLRDFSFFLLLLLNRHLYSEVKWVLQVFKSLCKFTRQWQIWHPARRIIDVCLPIFCWKLCHQFLLNFIIFIFKWFKNF